MFNQKKMNLLRYRFKYLLSSAISLLILLGPANMPGQNGLDPDSQLQNMQHSGCINQENS